jgi:hypothetical protein
MGLFRIPQTAAFFGNGNISRPPPVADVIRLAAERPIDLVLADEPTKSGWETVRLGQQLTLPPGRKQREAEYRSTGPDGVVEQQVA